LVHTDKQLLKMGWNCLMLKLLSLLEPDELGLWGRWTGEQPEQDGAQARPGGTMVTVTIGCVSMLWDKKLFLSHNRRGKTLTSEGELVLAVRCAGP
jgi:hypothetical protein